MNKFLAVGLGATAVVAVLLIGSNLLGSGSPPPGGPPTESVAPSDASSEAAVPTSAGPGDIAAIPAGTRLEPGDYAFTQIPGVQIVSTLGTGWERNEEEYVVWTIEDDKASIAALTVHNLYRNPCEPELGLLNPAVGPTVDDLVTALGAVPDLTFTEPVEITQDGFAGVRLDYASNTCPVPLGSWFLMSVNGGTDVTEAPEGDESASFYIYDVEGTRVVITASPTPQRAADLDAVLESIRFQ